MFNGVTSSKEALRLSTMGELEMPPNHQFLAIFREFGKNGKLGKIRALLSNPTASLAPVDPPPYSSALHFNVASIRRFSLEKTTPQTPQLIATCTRSDSGIAIAKLVSVAEQTNGCELENTCSSVLPLIAIREILTLE